jgi:protein-tyrosine phosphatase
MFSVPTVLFVCTANLYRSRIAEALFNHQAQSLGLGWCAFSRGMSTEMTTMSGLAPHARDALAARQVDPIHTAKDKTPLSKDDLEMAHIIIALSDDEHRPMVRDQFPDWLDQFNFWTIEDTHLVPPAKAVAAIAAEVNQLVDDLVAAGHD